MLAKSSLIILFFFLAAGFLAAQEEYVVFEQGELAYQVDFHPDSEYSWDIITQFNPLVPADSSAYNFIGENNLNNVTIHWKMAGRYYIMVTETNASGCTNSKVLSTLVLPNNRSVSFDALSGNSCFSSIDNSFGLALKTYNSEGQPLEESNFPLLVEFKVNGVSYSQQLSYNSQVLEISSQYFSAVANENTEVVVELTNVTDNNQISIQINSGNSIEKHTILAVPTVELLNAPDIVYLNSSYSFQAVTQPGYIYSWWYTDQTGSKTYFGSNSGSTENYLWETPGNYELFVQATDGNGCVTHVVSKSFTVEEQVVQASFLVALPDYIIGYNNSTINGSVSTNDFIQPNNNQNLVYSLVGDPVSGLTFLPDGSFTYISNAGFEGEINFTYKVCFEQQDLGCATSQAIIRVLPANASQNVAPVAVTDVYLTIPNQLVSNNLLFNDIDPDGSRTGLQITTSPIVNALHGTVAILANGDFTYSPDPGFEGTDKFMYRICDSGSPSLCDSAWVYFVVNDFGGTDSKPISTGDDVFLSQESAIFDVLQNDLGLSGQELVYNTTPVVDVQHGILQLFEDGSFSYIPDAGYFGIDNFTYEVCNTNTEQICRRGTATILILQSGTQLVDLAGKDTIISSCLPYRLNAAVNDYSKYSFKWEPAELLENPTSATPVFTPEESTWFSLTISDNNGAEFTDSVYITVSTVIANAGPDLVMLPNTTALLTGISSTGENLQYSWSTITGNIESGQNTPNPVISGFGTYYLQVTDLFGCSATDSVTVQELAQAPVAVDDYDTTNYRTEVIIPVLDNDTDPENSLNPASLTVTMPPFNGTAYVDYDHFTIHYRPNDDFYGNDNFEYQVCNNSNVCDQANVYVMVNDFRFLIPNAFSPNGDGINDYFEILGIEFYEGNSITIINRWGNKVYEAKNYGISTSPKFWDGKANTGMKLGNEDLTTGTYFYILDLGNGEKPIAGSIYLDR